MFLFLHAPTVSAESQKPPTEAQRSGDASGLRNWNHAGPGMVGRACRRRLADRRATAGVGASPCCAVLCRAPRMNNRLIESERGSKPKMHAWDGRRRGLEEWCQQFPFEGRLHRSLNEKPKYIQESTVRRGNFFWGPAGFFSNSESLLRLSSKAACFQQSYFYPVCLPAFASAGICVKKRS
jgi:hypothetical protein